VITGIARDGWMTAGNYTRVQGVLCFGSQDWWYHNRAHIDMQLMRRYARAVPVLYVNSIVMRKPNMGEGRMFITRVKRKTKSISRGVRRELDNFYVYSPLSLPVHHLSGARELNVWLVREQVLAVMRAVGVKRPLVYVACPAACDIALSLPHIQLAYQRTDRYEEYPGVDVDQIRRYDRKLKKEAGATFYVNHKMLEEENAQCRKGVFLDHGVDYERFASAGDDPFVPSEMAGLARPTVGFFGDIDSHLVDTELVENVARKMPDCHFVFIGSSSVDLRSLSELANTTLIPRRPYSEIAHYGKRFDVAIMPWRQNEWIECCNPIKLKEYLALGKPVVSTPFSELEYYEGLVYTGAGVDGFCAAIRKALREDAPRKTRARRERVRAYSWDSRARVVLSALGLEVTP